jgi:hypothetical protein
MEQMRNSDLVVIEVELGDRVIRDWAIVTTGKWMMIRNAGEEEPGDSFREFNRLRDSARQWSYRHGYQCEMRRREMGRRVWVRMTRRPKR